MSKTDAETKNRLMLLTIRCQRSDLIVFDMAAIEGGFTQLSPSKPNRSAWVLAVLREAAAAALGVKPEDFESFVKELEREHAEKIQQSPVKPRPKRKATARKPAGYSGKKS